MDWVDQVDLMHQVDQVDQVKHVDHVDHVDRVHQVDRPYSPVFSALLYIKLWFCRHFVLCCGASYRVLVPPPAAHQLRREKRESNKTSEV